MPVMNLFLRAIFTVEAVFSCVILGQYFAEELRAIRVSDRRHLSHRFKGDWSDFRKVINT
jgi:hypothetical protein